MRNRLLLSLIPALALAFIRCGGDSATGSDGGSGLTAKVDGKDWAATAVSIVAQANAGANGTVMILGSQTVDGKSLGITLFLYNVGGPGKYPMGVGSEVIGGTGLLGEGAGNGGKANSWDTPGTGTAGMAEITSLDGGRIVGTFSFGAEPDKNNAVGGNRDVTDGKIDLPLKGTLAKLPEGAGSKVSAVMNGTPYYAATILGGLLDFTGTAGVRINTLTSLQGISIDMVGVTAPGTYTYSNTAPQRLIVGGVNNGPAGSCCWGVNAPGDVDTIIVTSLTAKRIQGTFKATLKPQPGKAATADLVITDGTFDIGIP